MPPKSSIPSGMLTRSSAAAQSKSTQPSATHASRVKAPNGGEVKQPGRSDDDDLRLQDGGSGSNKSPLGATSLFSKQQLDGMSKEQLRVIILGLQARSNDPGQASSSRSYAPAQSNKRKHALISGGAASDGSDEDEDNEDDEDGDEENDEGDEYEVGINGEDDDESESERDENEEGGHNEQMKKIIAEHVRRSMYTASGCVSARDVKKTRYKSAGDPIFFSKNKRGVRLISPAWERPFEENWRQWGSQFIRQCRDKAGMGGDAAILKKVSDEQFKKSLRAGAWNLMGRFGREKGRGTFTKNKAIRDARHRNHSRQRTVSGRRSRSRLGTCVAHKKFNWLFNVKCHSRESSDSEDTVRSIMLEPAWRNPTVNKVFDALEHKALPHGRASQKSVVYIRVDTLPPVLGKNERYPFWALDPHWIETHPADFKRVESMFNKMDKAMPDVTSLLRKYRCPGRVYATDIPTPTWPRLSVRALPARPDSPASTIDLRSVSPPARVPEPSSSTQTLSPRPRPRLRPVVQPPSDKTPKASLPVADRNRPIEGPSSTGSSRVSSSKGPDEDSLGPTTSARISMRKNKKAKFDISIGGENNALVIKEERKLMVSWKQDKGKGRQVVQELDDKDDMMIEMAGTIGSGGARRERETRTSSDLE